MSGTYFSLPKGGMISRIGGIQWMNKNIKRKEQKAKH